MFDPNQPIVKVYPPLEDYEEPGDGGYDKGRRDPAWTRRREEEREIEDREGGGQTVSYRTYYGPDHVRGGRGRGKPPGPDDLGYAASNFLRIRSGVGGGGGDGMWEDTPFVRRDKASDEVFEESDLPGERRGKKGKKGSADENDEFAYGGYDDDDRYPTSKRGRNSSSKEEEEVERKGKDFLKNLIEEKFLALTTPLKKFVTRYLFLTGETTSEKMGAYIKVRKVFARDVPIRDWDDLVRAVYQPEEFGGDAFLGEEGFSTEELADAIFDMVTKDRQIVKRWYASRVSALRERLDREREGEPETPDQLQIAAVVERLKQNETLKGRTARRLLEEGYNRMVEGKVVFLLDDVLRESAQATLDAINAQGCRKGREAFTLIEVMRSDDPLTQFLQFMILKTQTLRNYQTVPMSPFAGGGIYSTLADRVSAGSAAYQKSNYGGKTINVFSRPTVANLVAASAEQRAANNYFYWVVREEREGGSALVFDVQARIRELRSGAGRSCCAAGGSYWSPLDSRSRCVTRCLEARERKPVQSLLEAQEDRYLGVENGGRSKIYDQDYLTTKELGTGNTLLIRKAMLDDAEAMRAYTKTGEIKEEYRVRKNPWKY